VTAAGLLLGLGYLFTGRLGISIGLHFSWNFFQGNVFGFPVSGRDFGASFVGISQGGPEVWTGGAFGPEAGLLGFLAYGLGGLLVLLWVRGMYGSVRLVGDIAVYSPD
jgi:membrane protease YdiL (CAAX protease family)